MIETIMFNDLKYNIPKISFTIATDFDYIDRGETCWVVGAYEVSSRTEPELCDTDLFINGDEWERDDKVLETNIKDFIKYNTLRVCVNAYEARRNPYEM